MTPVSNQSFSGYGLGLAFLRVYNGTLVLPRDKTSRKAICSARVLPVLTVAGVFSRDGA